MQMSQRSITLINTTNDVHNKLDARGINKVVAQRLLGGVTIREGDQQVEESA